ncbi:MAG: hypothetical protein ACPGU5_00590 [Lishizhenia sp.]
MNNYLIILISVLISTFSVAQNQWWENASDTVTEEIKKEGNVTVIKDARLSKLIDFKATANPPSYAPEIDGYRVQLFFDSDKNKVNQARANFLSSFPNEDTYTEFKAPNFHLKVGNFRTQLDAERLKSQLVQEFPTSIVIPEKVYYPRVELNQNVNSQKKLVE